MTKMLLIVTAVAEAGTGLVVVISPSLPVSLLLGSSLDTPAAMTGVRLAGIALLTLGAACWLSRNDARSRAAAGLVAAMLLYNVAVIVLLIHAALGLRLSGVGLWPVVFLHGVMAAWCLACLRKSSPMKSVEGA